MFSRKKKLLLQRGWKRKEESIPPSPTPQIMYTKNRSIVSRIWDDFVVLPPFIPTSSIYSSFSSPEAEERGKSFIYRRAITLPTAHTRSPFFKRRKKGIKRKKKGGLLLQIRVCVTASFIPFFLPSCTEEVQISVGTRKLKDRRRRRRRKANSPPAYNSSAFQRRQFPTCEQSERINCFFFAPNRRRRIILFPS